MSGKVSGYIPFRVRSCKCNTVLFITKEDTESSRGNNRKRAFILSRIAKFAAMHRGRHNPTKRIVNNKVVNQNGLWEGAPYFRARSKLNKFR